MKTEIQQLSLLLPAGFEKRAHRIGRLVGESLARHGDLVPGRIERLRVGPVQADVRHGDRVVAEHIADSIRNAVVAASRT